MKNKTRKILFFAVLNSLFLLNIYGQIPSIQWQKTLGGSNFDDCYAIQQTNDGGFIVAGATMSNNGDVTGHHGGPDCWVVKLNPGGTIQWQKTFGGSLGDVAYSIQQTNDGGYIVAGQSSSNNGDVTGHHGSTSTYDYWIVKLNAAGILQWQKSLGGSGYDQPLSVTQTNDRGYIIAGCSTSSDGDVTGHHGLLYDAWITKLDSTGTLQWQKSLGGTNNDGANAIRQTNDKGYIVAGYTNSIDGDLITNNGYSDYWVLKLDSAGTIQWQRSLGGTQGDYARDVKQTFDGGYIIGGVSYSNDIDATNNKGQGDYWVIKLDSIGTTKWQKNYGSTGDEWVSSLQQTTDGGYILAGTSDSLNGDVFGNHIKDYWIIKTDTLGVIEWQKTLGGSYSEWASSIQQTLDNGYVIAGSANSIDGDVSVNYGDSDFWVVKLAPLITESDQTYFNKTEIKLFPNPTKDKIIITQSTIEFKSFEIYTINGQLLQSNSLRSTKEIIDLSDYAKGMYFIKLIGNEKQLVKKVVLVD